jgi:hypothetical protein
MNSSLRARARSAIRGHVATTTGKGGVRIFDAQVVDLVAQIADDVLKSHDDVVPFR